MKDKHADTTYRLRYVIPASTGVAVARPPAKWLYSSRDQILLLDLQPQKFKHTLEAKIFTNVNQQRNFSFIAGANYSSKVASIITECYLIIYLLDL